MPRKKKLKTEIQKLREERAYKPQPFEIPPNEKDPIANSYTKNFHYMLTHPNYIKLSPSAMIVLTYMKDWAFTNIDYLKTGIFEFSTTMLQRLGVMTQKTTMSAQEELQHYKFIRKENNPRGESGETTKWSFSDEWQKGEITAPFKKSNKKTSTKPLEILTERANNGEIKKR